MNKISIFPIIILLLAAILLGCGDNKGFIDEQPSDKELSAYPQAFVLKQGQTQKIDLTTSVVGKNIESWSLSQLEYNTQLGTITAQTANSFDYTAQKAGENIINYTVQSGDLTASSQIIIVVSEDVPDNHQPIANNIIITTDSDTPITIDLRNNISDADGDPLQIHNLITASEHFTLKDYMVTYTPNGFIGLDQAVYTIDDGHGGYALAYIAVTSKDTTPVPDNHQPIANNITITTDSETPVTIDLRSSISDVDGDPLQIHNLITASEHFTLKDYIVTYTPNGFVGLDQAVYAVDDGHGGYALAYIAVTSKDTTPVPDNHQPIANNITITTDSETPVTIDLRNSISDVDGDPLQIHNLITASEHFTLKDYIVTYTPNGFVGLDQAVYTIDDGHGGYALAYIAVTSKDTAPVPDNHQPIANNITITTDSETPITIDLRNSISDVDGDQLQINKLTTASERFILEGYIVTYTPNGFVGLDQAVYSIDDGHGGYALAYIAVTSKDTTPTPSNSSPIAHDYSQTLDPAITPTLDINLVELNLISDPDGDTLKIARIYSGNNRALILDDNTIRYTPGDFFGLDQFTYAIVDTSGNYALGTISVNVKNNQPQSIIKIYVEQNVFGTKINTIPAQGQANLTAAKINIDGSIVNVTNTVQWYSSDNTLLSIDKAIAYAKKEGEVNIQAKLDDLDSNIITINILNDTLKYIDISPKNTTVRKYETLQFSAIAHYDSGLISDITNLASWSSDNEDIASNNDGGSFIFNKDGKVTIKATFNDMTSNESAIYVQPATLESLTITAPTYSIPAGVSLQLFAEGVFNDKQKYNLSSSTKWTITGPGATIDNQGVFVGNTLGTITVIGSINDIVSNEININVVDAKIDSLTISPSIVAVPLGLSMPVTLLAHYTDGTTNNSFDGVSWHSSNENIVSVDNNGNIQGLNIGVSYVYATKLGVKSNEIAIAVINAKITKIEVSPSYASISKGTKQIYKAYATYSDATQYDLTSSVVWESNNTDIVEISTDGIAYGHNSGEVSIKATFDGIESNSATLIIKPALLTSVELQPKHASVMVGGTINYTANGVYSDDSIDNVNTLLTWRSSDESIAKITAAGEIIGVSNGDVVINAYTTIDGKLVDSQSTLHVDATKLINNIEIGQLTDFKDINAGKVLASSSSGSDTLIKVEGITNNILTPDSSRQIYAKATYTDGSTSYITGDVLWSSSDTNIATIDRNGMVRTFSTGEVIISAQKYGIKSNNFSFSVDNMTYTACPTEKVSLFINLATGGIQQLEFTCPAIMGDPNIYGNAIYLPEENGFFGPNHMPVAKQPMQNDGTNNSPITYCQRLGYRLTTNNELVKLWQALDGNREGVSGLYTNIGWPTLSEYWGDQKVAGEYTSIVNMVGGHILFAHDTYYTYYSCISNQSTTP